MKSVVTDKSQANSLAPAIVASMCNRSSGGDSYYKVSSVMIKKVLLCNQHIKQSSAASFPLGVLINSSPKASIDFSVASDIDAELTGTSRGSL